MVFIVFFRILIIHVGRNGVNAETAQHKDGLLLQRIVVLCM